MWDLPSNHARPWRSPAHPEPRAADGSPSRELLRGSWHRPSFRSEPEVQNGKKDDAKTREEALAKATRLLREVQGGQDFATVARDYSEDPTSVAAGVTRMWAM